LRQWTFVWVYGKDIADAGENQAEDQPINIVAIDPGVINFLSWYSPSIGHGLVGHQDIERVIRLCHRLDDLISRTTKAPSCKRCSMKRAQVS
jgi:hypothetical protein